MSDGQTHTYDPPVPKHPLCPTCGVPMWLVRLDSPVPGDPTKDKLYYECQACEATAVLPRL